MTDLMSVDQYIAARAGKITDVDGNGGWCVDTGKDYGVCSVGVPTFSTLTGDGKKWFAPNGPWQSYYTQVTGLGKKGDIVAFGAPHGIVDGVVLGHVGVLAKDDTGGALSVFSQRQPGAAATTATIARTGLIGFLRPKRDISVGTGQYATTKKAKWWYTSIAALALAIGVPAGTIIALNPGTSESTTVEPSAIKIPGGATEKKPEAEGGSSSQGADSTTGKHAAQAVVTVAAGDTLYTIASRHGLIAADGSVDWQAIVDANRADIEARTIAAGLPIDATHPLGWWIFPDQQLTIPTA